MAIADDHGRARIPSRRRRRRPRGFRCRRGANQRWPGNFANRVGYSGRATTHLQDVGPVVQSDADHLAGAGMTVARSLIRQSRAVGLFGEGPPVGWVSRAPDVVAYTCATTVPSSAFRPAGRGSGAAASVADGGQPHRVFLSIWTRSKCQSFHDGCVAEPEHVKATVAARCRNGPGDPGRHHNVALGDLVIPPARTNLTGPSNTCYTRVRPPYGPGSPPRRSRWNSARIVGITSPPVVGLM